MSDSDHDGATHAAFIEVSELQRVLKISVRAPEAARQCWFFGIFLPLVSAVLPSNRWPVVLGAGSCCCCTWVTDQRPTDQTPAAGPLLLVSAVLRGDLVTRNVTSFGDKLKFPEKSGLRKPLFFQCFSGSSNGNQTLVQYF